MASPRRGRRRVFLAGDSRGTRVRPAAVAPSPEPRPAAHTPLRRRSASGRRPAPRCGGRAPPRHADQLTAAVEFLELRRRSARTSAAAMLSSRCATDDVPGIGSITGERRSSQASASWDGVGAVLARRVASSGPPGRGQLAGGQREPRDEPDAVAPRSTPAASRPRGWRGCTGSAPRRSCAICARPPRSRRRSPRTARCARILPSSWSSFSSPTCSASGTFGSIRCSWNRSMRSSAEVAQAQLGLLAQVLRAGRPGASRRARSGSARPWSR